MPPSHDSRTPLATPVISRREAMLRRAEVALLGEVAQAAKDREFATEQDASTALKCVRRLITKEKERAVQSAMRT